MPLQHADIEVELTEEEVKQLRGLTATGKFGEAEAEVLRYIFFT